MSCINNSTISGIIVSGASSTATSGKRLSFQQNTSVHWNSSISAGDVIRYDVDAAGFTKSIANPAYDANGLSNAEVVGVVESIGQISGITYATIVIHGLMNYPGLTGTIAGISATSGGIGGTDIFFLSPTVAGGITFEIPEGSGYIAKPVLQVCPTSDENYNSVVINYLGYETSQSAEFTVANSEGSVGELRLISPYGTIPEGWIDSATATFLLISEYPEAYNVYRTAYGSKERLTISASSSFVSALAGTPNLSVRPVDPDTGLGFGPYSLITNVDTNNNTITIENTSNANLWESAYRRYQLSEKVSNIAQISVEFGELTHFKTPAISTNIIINSGQSYTPYKNILRVKPDTRVSYLPTNVTFNNVTITGTMGTQNIANIDTKLVNLETRILQLESRLGI